MKCGENSTRTDPNPIFLPLHGQYGSPFIVELRTIAALLSVNIVAPRVGPQSLKCSSVELGGTVKSGDGTCRWCTLQPCERCIG
jgi:hypothetical protein